MTILVFRRPMHGHAPLPYCEWLAEREESVVLFTTGHDADERAFAHVERFASFDADGLTELRALELARKFRFSAVFAQSEHDLIRAAELREWLGLAGQSLESALAFRDKVRMKTLARAAGIATPEFAAFERPLDLVRFTRDHGFPCVVKPRWGAGARGIEVLRSQGDVERFLARPVAAGMMVESYDAAPLHHVDGIAEKNELIFATASSYYNTCVSYQEGESTGSILLDPASPLAERLFAAARAVLRAMPPTEHLAIHAEFFGDAAGVRLCEIAARPGGSRATDGAALVYGIDFYQQWVRRSFGLPIALPPPRPWCGAGTLLVPPRAGRLHSAPDAIPFDWVVDYHRNGANGARYETPSFSGAHVASFLVQGAEHEEVRSRITHLDTWFRQQLVWEEPALAASA